MSQASFDRTEAARFLERWFELAAGELLEIRPLNKRAACRPLGREWFTRIDRALAHVERCVAHGDDVYLGALPRSMRAGGAQAIGTRRWLWADVDYGDVGHARAAKYASRADALRAIDASRIAPTMVIDTGGGFHVWWALEEAASPAAWERAVAGACAMVGGDSAVNDAPRILRVPGTLNFKADEPRPVSLIRCEATRARVEEFLPFAPADAAPPPPAALARSAPGDRPFDRANAIPIADVLRWLGVQLHVEGARTYCACPAHGGKNHHQMVVGGERNVAHCFGDCRRFFSPVDIVARVRGCQPREAVDVLAERFGFEGFARSHAEPTKRSSDERPADTPRAARVAAADDWHAELAQTANGLVRNTLGNIVVILRNHEPFAGKLSYDEMRLTPLLAGDPLTDTDVARVRVQIERDFGFSPAADNVRAALAAVAEEHSFHPVRRYLEGLRWDGHHRIERVVPDLLGVRDGNVALATTMVRKWFISAVARAMQPGCKVDTTLVLVGPQRWHKSSFFRILGGEWFADTFMDITSTDGKLQLHSAWIYEWAELESITTKRQASDIKQFITSQTDVFRAPYGRAVAPHPRATVIVGTTNETQFLADPTGSRRFWIVQVTRRPDLQTIEDWRDQLWAEATVAYASGEKWWLEDDEEVAREEAAAPFELEDPWEAPIARWLESPAAKREPVTSSRVLIEALDVDLQNQTQAGMNRVGRIMRALGWDNPLQRIAGRRVRVWRRLDAGAPARATNTAAEQSHSPVVSGVSHRSTPIPAHT